MTTSMIERAHAAATWCDAQRAKIPDDHHLRGDLSMYEREALDGRRSQLLGAASQTCIAADHVANLETKRAPLTTWEDTLRSGVVEFQQRVETTPSDHRDYHHVRSALTLLQNGPGWSDVMPTMLAEWFIARGYPDYFGGRGGLKSNEERLAALEQEIAAARQNLEARVKAAEALMHAEQPV